MPYQIIFLLLGVLAILVGICVIVWLPDSPVNARRLTTEERIAALERVRDGQAGTENRHLKKEQVIEALADLRTWLIALIVIMCRLTLRRQLGGTGADTNCSQYPKWSFQ